MKFADLSGEYQPNVDLSAYRAAGYVMLAHKASEGVSYADPRLAVRWQAMADLGIGRIAYHFLRGTSGPVDQAHHFLDVLNAAGGLRPGDILALDYEASDASNVGAVTWLQAIRANAPAQRLLLYSGDWYLRPRGLRAADVPERIGYWLSAYVPQSRLAWYQTPGWPVPCAWQFTDAAQVPGLGTVDCSMTFCDLQHLYPGLSPNRFASFRTLKMPTQDPITGPLPDVPYAPADYPVHAWQYSCNLLFGTTLAWDGVFGPASAAAAQDFQRNHGLVADGIVGPATWAALDAAADARSM